MDLARAARSPLVVFLPNLVWNVQHDWPFLELMRNVRASGRDVVLGPVEYVLHQVAEHEPADACRCGSPASAGCSSRGAAGRYRPLGWAFVVALAVFIVTKGKDYYLAPAFATLFAAGARRARGLRGRAAGGGCCGRLLVARQLLLSAAPAADAAAARRSTA